MAEWKVQLLSGFIAIVIGMPFSWLFLGWLQTSSKVERSKFEAASILNRKQENMQNYNLCVSNSKTVEIAKLCKGRE